MKAHFEPYLYLAGLTHKSALIAWGGFYFRIARAASGWRLIDDSDLDHVHPPRSSSIGSHSYPYGHGRVEVSDESGQVVATGETRTANSRVDGIDYFVTGGAGKVRTGRPGGFTSAGTLAWAPSAHFLLVRIAGARAEVTAVGEDGRPLPAVDPSGEPVTAHTVVER